MKKNLKKFKNLNAPEIAIQEVTIKFIEKYFCEKDYTIENVDWFWIGGVIGEILSVGDYFFSYEAIQYCIKYNVDEEILFGWYDFVVEKDIKISIQEYSDTFIY